MKRTFRNPLAHSFYVLGPAAVGLLRKPERGDCAFVYGHHRAADPTVAG